MQTETVPTKFARSLLRLADERDYEIALACHYRVALDHKSVQVGLPEAQLGLMPGAGGIVRLTRMLGMHEALTLISQGKRLKSKAALEQGLVDELAASEDEMAGKAKAWIKANLRAQQLWDKKDYKMPGGGPAAEANQGLMYFLRADERAGRRRQPARWHSKNQREKAGYFGRRRDGCGYPASRWKPPATP